MNVVYMNYASTSPSVPETVADTLDRHLREGMRISAGRGPSVAGDAARTLDARLALCRLFGMSDPARVLFTSGATASLNMALHGLAVPGCHVLATSVEHNAAARPLALLESQGVIEVTWLQCRPDGTLEPELVKSAVRSNTTMLVMTHASNVLGTLLPAEDCFAEAKRFGLLTVMDAAQTAGSLPVRMSRNTDVLVFTGHKGLRALPGIGGFLLSGHAAQSMRPWMTGGTGSLSHSLEQPECLPDKFEPGTPNMPGIISLGASAGLLLQSDSAAIRAREMTLTQRFIDGARALPVTVHGTCDAARSSAVVSVSVPGHDSGVLAGRLYEEYGIVTRGGLHCAPLAHRTAGTFPNGTVRFSFGFETTESEIDFALDALRNYTR